MKGLKIYYFVLIAFVIVWIALNEGGFIPLFTKGASQTVLYVLSLICVTTAVGGSFMACYLIAMPAVRKHLDNSPNKPLLIFRLNVLRLFFVSLAILPSLILYKDHLYCLLIAIVSALFCFPSEDL